MEIYNSSRVGTVYTVAHRGPNYSLLFWTGKITTGGIVVPEFSPFHEKALQFESEELAKFAAQEVVQPACLKSRDLYCETLEFKLLV